MLFVLLLVIGVGVVIWTRHVLEKKDKLINLEKAKTRTLIELIRRRDEGILTASEMDPIDALTWVREEAQRVKKNLGPKGVVNRAKALEDN